jgi:hypothetical protein
MESELGRRIQVALSTIGARMFRNNVGLGWIGSPVQHFSRPGIAQVKAGDVLIHNARPLHAGLCEGSSDYIGFNPITITQEMVGARVAVFVACEVKTAQGRVSEAQKNFIAAVKQSGGVAFVARSPEEAINNMKGDAKCHI